MKKVADRPKWTFYAETLTIPCYTSYAWTHSSRSFSHGGINEAMADRGGGG